MDCCLHDNDVKMSLYVSVVMRDHVHMIFTPLINQKTQEIHSLANIMDAVKGGFLAQDQSHLGKEGSGLAG
jgi:hypothetical protein